MQCRTATYGPKDIQDAYFCSKEQVSECVTHILEGCSQSRNMIRGLQLKKAQISLNDVITARSFLVCKPRLNHIPD